MMMASRNNSNNHENNNSKNKAKNTTIDLIQRLGGESMFEFIVFGFVQNLKEDRRLAKFFKNFTTNDLVLLQKQFLTTVFAHHHHHHHHQQQEDGGHDNFDLDGYIQLRYLALAQRGFNATHFDLLVDHFINAMDDGWVDDSVTRDVISILKPLRRLFVVVVLAEQIEEGCCSSCCCCCCEHHILGSPRQHHRTSGRQQQQQEATRTRTTTMISH